VPIPTQLPYAKSSAKLIRVVVTTAALSHFPDSKYEIGYCNNQYCNIIQAHSFALLFSIPNGCLEINKKLGGVLTDSRSRFRRAESTSSRSGYMCHSCDLWINKVCAVDAHESLASLGN